MRIMRIAVTGAFGYSGRYITGRLLDAGHVVTTLTNSLRRANPFGARIRVCGFDFDAPEKLRESLRGIIDCLINTYWVRFDHRLFTHEQAVAYTKILFTAAKEAGVRSRKDLERAGYSNNSVKNCLIASQERWSARSF